MDGERPRDEPEPNLEPEAGTPPPVYNSRIHVQ